MSCVDTIMWIQTHLYADKYVDVPHNRSRDESPRSPKGEEMKDLGEEFKEKVNLDESRKVLKYSEGNDSDEEKPHFFK